MWQRIFFFFVSILIMLAPVSGVRALLDTDRDGYPDEVEIKNGFDPKDPRPLKLAKRIEIDLKKQELTYYLGDIELGRHKISAGKKGWSTPKGEFRVLNKRPRAWSRLAGLWMPYWMAFTPRGHGIHELPVWPTGRREGAHHLGKPVSHGCVRLGIGPSQALYDWADVGTKVVVR